jgi:hypothetical protein
MKEKAAPSPPRGGLACCPEYQQCYFVCRAIYIFLTE